MSRRRGALVLAATALATVGCGAHVVSPGIRPATIDPDLRARAGATPVSYEFHASGDPHLPAGLIERALRASLAAQGVRDAIPSDSVLPGRLHLSIHVLPDDATCATRCVGVPWGFLSLATLGLVPYAEVHGARVVIDAVAVGRDGPRVRVLRSSYTVSATLGWLAQGDEHGDLPGEAPGESSAYFRATHVALRRTFDAALAELLGSPASR